MAARFDPKQHHTRKNRPSSIKNRESRIEHQDALYSYTLIRLHSSTFCPRQVSNILDKSPPFLYKRTQFRKQTKSTQAQSQQRITETEALRHDPKTNPNEPKTNPIFRSSGAPKAKTNPIEPNLSRRSPLATAKSCTKPGCRSRIEPDSKPAPTPTSFCFSLFFALTIIWQCKTGPYRSC